MYITNVNLSFVREETITMEGTMTMEGTVAMGIAM